MTRVSARRDSLNPSKPSQGSRRELIRRETFDLTFLRYFQASTNRNYRRINDSVRSARRVQTSRREVEQGAPRRATKHARVDVARTRVKWKRRSGWRSRIASLRLARTANQSKQDAFLTLIDFSPTKRSKMENVHCPEHPGCYETVLVFDRQSLKSAKS